MAMLAAISLKGGVGRTSVVLGLAATAWAAGHRTLIIGLDPQANATDALDPEPYAFTTDDVLADGRTGIAAEVIVASRWGPGIDLIAGDRALEHRAHPEGVDSALRLRVAPSGALERYEAILIDCPPSLGELTRNAPAATPAALIVTERSHLALVSAEQALEAVEIARLATNLALRPAGIVVNPVRRSAEHTFRLDELRGAYPGPALSPPIPDRVAMADAQSRALPLTALHSPGPVTSPNDSSRSPSPSRRPCREPSRAETCSAQGLGRPHPSRGGQRLAPAPGRRTPGRGPHAPHRCRVPPEERGAGTTRLSGPPGGTASDSLRAAAKRSRRHAARPRSEKSVGLTVKMPKSRRQDFRAVARANGRTPDEVVTALMRAWLDG